MGSNLPDLERTAFELVTGKARTSESTDLESDSGVLGVAAGRI